MQMSLSLDLFIVVALVSSIGIDCLNLCPISGNQILRSEIYKLDLTSYSLYLTGSVCDTRQLHHLGCYFKPLAHGCCSDCGEGRLL